MASMVRDVILHRHVGLALLAVLLALAPAADATPPDQTWIAALYDDAEFDDVSLFLTSGLGAVPPSMGWSLRPTVPVVGLVTTRGTVVRPLLPLSSAFSRAPPPTAFFMARSEESPVRLTISPPSLM